MLGLQSLSQFIHAFQMGYAHRDVKPDNFLIDAEGHLKVCQACINPACTTIRILVQIADFGTCSRVDDNGHMLDATSAIGTPGFAGTWLHYHTVLDLFHLL